MKGDAQKLKEQLNSAGVISFVPNGRSMWPIFKGGKQSVIVSTKNQRLKPFDVALYSRQDGTAVLHRVIEVTEKGYIVCGDGQINTEIVLEEEVFGVLQGFFRGQDYISALDKDYLATVNKWYKNENRRRRKIKGYLIRQKIRSIFKK